MLCRLSKSCWGTREPPTESSRRFPATGTRPVAAVTHWGWLGRGLAATAPHPPACSDWSLSAAHVPSPSGRPQTQGAGDREEGGRGKETASLSTGHCPQALAIGTHWQRVRREMGSGRCCPWERGRSPHLPEWWLQKHLPHRQACRVGTCSPLCHDDVTHTSGGVTGENRSPLPLAHVRMTQRLSEMPGLAGSKNHRRGSGW